MVDKFILIYFRPYLPLLWSTDTHSKRRSILIFWRYRFLVGTFLRMPRPGLMSFCPVNFLTSFQQAVNSFLFCWSCIQQYADVDGYLIRLNFGGIEFRMVKCTRSVIYSFNIWWTLARAVELPFLMKLASLLISKYSYTFVKILCCIHSCLEYIHLLRQILF